MNRFLQFSYFAFSLIYTCQLFGQVTINSGQNAQALVNNLVGVGVTTNNPQIVAAPNSVGTFTATNSNIGLSSGVILTTGLAPTTAGFFGVNQGCPVVPGLSFPQTSGAFASTSHDFFPVNVPELQTLFPQNQQFFDRASLTFQFVPQSTPVTFRYVFASEEWPEWVNTAFNDVFGFFISGPGIVGEQNIAVLPSTNTPITATTMNASAIVNNQNPATCAYNAFTPVFTATANVIPCSTYTIKLIIADVGDSSFDSAVFLEEGSFGSAPFIVETSSLANDDITYEGCAPATITFSRPNATNQPLIINYTIGGTATMGVDYQTIPTSVTIPAGQTSTSIQIVGIEDNFPELTETIILTYSTGCNTFETITIFLMDKPPVTATVADAPSICNGSGPVALSATGGGGLPPLTYSWSGGAGNTANVNVNPNTTTIYTVTVTDFCGTTATASTIVNVAPIPSPPVLTNNGPLCEGAPLTFSASNVANGTFNWTGPNNFQSTNQNPLIPSATTTNAGTYSATVTVDGCTSAPANTNVVINAAPAPPALGSNAPICAGSSLNLTATGPAGGTYNWTGPDGFNSALQNPTINNISTNQAGQFSATVTLNGCTSQSATISPVVNPIPASPTASSNSPVCGANTLSLSASNVAGGSFGWTGPNGFTSNVQNPIVGNMSQDLEGDYAVTVTVNGCTSQPSVTTAILASTEPPVITYNAPVCQGQTLTLSGPVFQNTTYAWTGPNGFTSTAQSPSINGVSLAAIGQYSLVLNIGGCITDLGFVDVMINPTPAAPQAGNAGPICEGQLLNLNAENVNGATYNWTGPNNYTANTQNPQIANVPLGAAGNYNVTVTVNGCTSAPGNTNVLINPIPAAPTLLSNSPICEGSSLELTAQNVNGGTYNWTGPNGFNSDLQAPNIQNSQTSNSGNYNVTVTVNACQSPVATINVVVNPIPSAPEIIASSPVCLGAQLTLSTPLPQGVVTYNWSGPAGFSSNIQNPIITGISENNEGDYALSITVNSCPSPTSIQFVEVVDLPQPNAGLDISFCSGESGAIGAAGLPNITYTWSPANGLSDSNSPNPSVTLSNTGTQPQNFAYTLTSSVSGCSLTDQVVVTVFPEPVVSFTIPDAQCFNVNNFSFNALGTFSSGAIYNWDFGPSANQPNSNLRNPSGISFANTGQHPVSVQVTDNGCTGQVFTANVVVHSMPVANFVSDLQEGCSPLKISFTNLSESQSGTLSYQWLFGNGNSSQANNPVHIYNNAGEYTVRLTATTVNGCADTYVVNNYIKSFPRATADFRSFPWELEIIKPEIELTSFSENAVDGFYIIGEGGTVIEGLDGNHTFTEEGVYPITHVAINEFGCNDTIVKNVIVRTGFRLYFPSAFTPNVDDKNDLFRPYGEGFTNFRIQIFNRWGELLYTSYDIENGWDGSTKLSNKSVPSDMYFYRAFAADEVGKEHEFSGWVMLLK